MSDGIRSSIRDLALPVEQLTPHPDNPNDGDQDALVESLQVNGQYRPIVAWRRPEPPHVILAGNTTYAAALSLGWSQLAVTFVDAADEQEAWRILLADNRYARLARMNLAQELDLLQAIDSLAGTGYVPDDIERLSRQLEIAGLAPVDPSAEWEASGMPSYETQDLMPAYSVKVHFRSTEDADRFFREVLRRDGRPGHSRLAPYAWWPEVDGHRGMDANLRVDGSTD